MDPAKELRAWFFKTQKWRLNRCLAPGESCNAAAIRAHSVQNSQVLDLLVRGAHVKTLTKRVDKKTGPQIFFDDVGRNQATTFSGLCSEHDASIFRPIDRKPLSVSDSEQLFLMAYRAVIRELHTTMEAGSMVQSAYEQRVSLGLDPGDEPSIAGMLAVQHMVKAYETYLYKNEFDKAFCSRQFNRVAHDVVHIAHEEPTVGVCSLFGLDSVADKNDWVRVALNVIPIDYSTSVAIFGYLLEEKVKVRQSLSPLFNAAGHYQKYLLSKHILNSCENFVVSPSYFEKWSEKKKEAIVAYFVKTLFAGNLDVEDEHLYLF